jgi:hypothetical protein
MITDYTCDKCNHQFKLDLDYASEAPVLKREKIRSDGSTVTFYNPVCPLCWDKFIRSQAGIGIGEWEKMFGDQD